MTEDPSQRESVPLAKRSDRQLCLLWLKSSGRSEFTIRDIEEDCVSYWREKGVWRKPYRYKNAMREMMAWNVLGEIRADEIIRAGKRDYRYKFDKGAVDWEWGSKNEEKA